MNRLNNDLLGTLPDEIKIPAYDRSATGIGIVHLGPGAFHRSHQAYFTEVALQHGGDWGICGVSLNSSSVKDALTPQQGLYTLAIQEQENRFQIIGAIKELLQLEPDRAEVMARLLNPQTKVVTLTVTEKGYCLDSSGNLDLSNTSIEHDLAEPDCPISAIGLLVQAIKMRLENGVNPFLVISCDNVTENGSKLKSAVVQFAAACGTPMLVDHIQSEMHFPCTMVDSITPATDQQLRETIREELNYEDAWPIKREAFAQWVIETTPVTDLPAWELAGVMFTDDIEGFENAKLRLLNLPHSCLAYVGRLLGLNTVYEAITQPQLAAFVRAMVDDEVIPSCAAPAGLSLPQYRDDILKRFHNPSIKHLLEQIAYDGSQKLQMRLIPVIKTNLQEGRSIEKLCLVLAAWFEFIVSKAQADEPLVDPMRDTLVAAASLSAATPENTVHRFLAIESLFDNDLATHAQFIASLTTALTTIRQSGAAAALE